MSGTTRERLVETAAQLFHAGGYAATGVGAILREAGLNPGSLYHFFDSKQDLLAAVLRWYEAHLRPIVLDPIEAAEGDPLERIFALLAWYREGMVAAGCALGCPVGNLALELSDTQPEVRGLIDVNLRNWAAGIREWLEQAGDRLPPDTDREALSLFVLTVMEGGLLQARAARSLDPYDACVRVLRHHFDLLTESAP